VRSVSFRNVLATAGGATGIGTASAIDCRVIFGTGKSNVLLAFHTWIPINS